MSHRRAQSLIFFQPLLPCLECLSHVSLHPTQLVSTQLKIIERSPVFWTWKAEGMARSGHEIGVCYYSSLLCRFSKFRQVPVRQYDNSDVTDTYGGNLFLRAGDAWWHSSAWALDFQLLFMVTLASGLQACRGRQRRTSRDHGWTHSWDSRDTFRR